MYGLGPRPRAPARASSQALQPDPPRIRGPRRPGRLARWSSASCLPTDVQKSCGTNPTIPTVCTPSPGGAQYRVHTRVRVHVIPKRLFITSLTKQLSGLCIPLFVRRNDHPPRRSPRARTTLGRRCKDTYTPTRLTAGRHRRETPRRIRSVKRDEAERAKVRGSIKYDLVPGPDARTGCTGPPPLFGYPPSPQPAPPSPTHDLPTHHGM